MGLTPKYNAIDSGHLKSYSDSDVGGTAPADCTCWNMARAVGCKSWTFHLGQRALAMLMITSHYDAISWLHWWLQAVASLHLHSLQETLQLLPSRGSLLPYLLCLDWPCGLLVNLQWKCQCTVLKRHSHFSLRSLSPPCEQVQASLLHDESFCKGDTTCPIQGDLRPAHSQHRNAELPTWPTAGRR